MMMCRNKKTPCLLFAILVIGFVWLSGSGPVAQANVTLLSFDVVRDITPTALKVQWETASETGTVGFSIKRSETNNLQQANVVQTVPNRGSATGGGVYEVTDSGLTTGQTYYYWLIELRDDNSEQVLSDNPESESPGDSASPTNTPTHTATSVPTQPTFTKTPTATAVSTQPAATNTPTATAVGTQATSTTTPTAPRSNLTATPTATLPGATPTFTPPAQPSDTPGAGSSPTPIPTSTPLAASPTTATDAPVAAGTTPVVTPSPAVTEPLVRAGETVGADQEGIEQPTEQTLQVPSSPTQTTDTAETSGEAAVGVTPTVQSVDPTPQAVVQGLESGESEPAERLARPTATPRPTTTGESEDSSGSLLLILGGASLCGAVALALAALVIWRRR